MHIKNFTFQKELGQLNAQYQYVRASIFATSGTT